MIKTEKEKVHIHAVGTFRTLISEGSASLVPAVMYWDGALAPEDRRAPAYLQGETGSQQETHRQQPGIAQIQRGDGEMCILKYVDHTISAATS